MKKNILCACSPRPPLAPAAWFFGSFPMLPVFPSQQNSVESLSAIANKLLAMADSLLGIADKLLGIADKLLAIPNNPWPPARA